jgi:solute carrier family 25 folate transporter 32
MIKTVRPTSSSNVSPQKNISAAAIAAALSTIVVQPLDVLKTRLQVSYLPRYVHHRPIRGIAYNLHNIFTAEGIRGLYRGLVPSLVSVVPSISIYFTLYCEIKHLVGVHPGNGDARNALLQAASAGAASCMTAALTNPLWVVKTRMQTQPHAKLVPPKYRNTWHTLCSISRDEGIRALYKGLGASLITSTQAMIQFPVYEKLKSLLCQRFNQNTHQAALCFLASSSIAACFSCMVTYPSEVVRARMQIQGMQVYGLHVQGKAKSFPAAYQGTFSAFRKIWYEEGARGLYRGMLTNLVRLVPAHAISFTVYEVILRWWRHH